FRLLESAAVLQERGVPLPFAEREAAQVALRVGRVYRYDMELRELNRYGTALGCSITSLVVHERVASRQLLRESVADGFRLGPAEDRGAGVTLLHRRAPVLVVVRQVNLHLATLGLRLLETEYVRLVRIDELQEAALAQDRPEAVHVPGEDLHHGSEWCESSTAGAR